MYMFYHDVLGLKDVFAGHARWPRGALLSSDERHQGVELFKVDETKNQTPGFVHFGFSVKNIDAWIEKLKAWGVEIVRIGIPYPNEKLQVRIAFFNDPEGNLVEIIEWTELK